MQNTMSGVLTGVNRAYEEIEKLLEVAPFAFLGDKTEISVILDCKKGFLMVKLIRPMGSLRDSPLEVWRSVFRVGGK